MFVNVSVNVNESLGVGSGIHVNVHVHEDQAHVLHPLFPLNWREARKMGLVEEAGWEEK